MVLNTATVSLAVTPTICSTLFSHYLNRKTLKHRPTAHLSYDEGLHLVRQFLIYASHHTVEEVQAFMSQWVPHPQWVRVEPILVPANQLANAASLLEEQLGPEGVRRVGGRQWWQWRKPKSPLRAEWIEMRTDANNRRHAGGGPGRRIMLYVHGGAYYMGSVDEHRYQLQRHARKLKARVLAPRYRLAPQFPFPCGLQDCLATYLHLLTLQEPSTILLAGDSAGGGMVLSMLVVLRDRGIPLPAGAILISPWVDLTHSFPSLDQPCPMDYIPPHGFHQRPSVAWPPPTDEVLEEMHRLDRLAHLRRPTGQVSASDSSDARAAHASHASAHTDDSFATAPEDSELEAMRAMFNANHGTLTTDEGEVLFIREQIQMYTTNNMLTHPLVSPVMQPTLGGLPPLMVLTGGGEILRDEQMYIAHKCANPAKYTPPEERLSDADRAAIAKYPPTDVQLQVWDDLCHVAPTLSFTRPAKFMYRAIAQFGAWALSRAQKTEVYIENDEEAAASSISSHEDAMAASIAESTGDNGNLDGAIAESPGDNENLDGAIAGHANELAHEIANELANGLSNGLAVSNGLANGLSTGLANGLANTTTTKSGKGGKGKGKKPVKDLRDPNQPRVGKAGDPLPPFKDHMIRQRVSVKGDIFPLAKASELPGCTMPRESIGMYKKGPVRRWIRACEDWDARYSKDRDRVLKQRLKDAAGGFESFGPGEHPPPGALAGRRKIGADLSEKEPRRSRGLALWAKWSSRHDEHTLEREGEAVRPPSSSVASDEEEEAEERTETAWRQDRRMASAGSGNGEAVDPLDNDGADDGSASDAEIAAVDGEGEGENATAGAATAGAAKDTPKDTPKDSSGPDEATHFSDGRLLNANGSSAKSGVTGKRPFFGGIALPFSVRREADTASMVTLDSGEPRPTTSNGTAATPAPQG